MKFKIKGEYEFNIILTRMFKQYQFKIKGENKITDKGIEFFLKRIAGFTTDTIYEICLGKKENGESSLGDGEKSGTEQVSPAIGLENNKLILQSTILTDDIGGVNEIGVKTEGESLTGQDSILISYDEFEKIEDLGVSANFILKYIYTFSNNIKDIEWIVTKYNNIYKAEYEKTISQILNKTQTEYQKYQNFEEILENPYSFYQNNTTVYINTPENPINENLLIY